MIGHYITLVNKTLCDNVTTCFWPVGLLLFATIPPLVSNPRYPPPSTFLLWIMSQVWPWIDWILAEFCWRKMMVLVTVSFSSQGFVCPCCQRRTALVLHKNRQIYFKQGLAHLSLSLSLSLLDRGDDRRTSILARISSVPWKIHGDDYNSSSSSSSSSRLEQACDRPSCSDWALSTNYSSVQIQYSTVQQCNGLMDYY
jgi:hypothetical protein